LASVFTAQFALTHACWLFTYPLAGWLGEIFGIGPAMILLSLISLAGSVNALWVWPMTDPEKLFHEHYDLPDNHPHYRDKEMKDGRQGRRHRFIIDDEHKVWSTQG